MFYGLKTTYFKNFLFWNLFRPLKKTTPTANAAFVTILKLVEKWNRNNLSSSGHS